MYYLRLSLKYKTETNCVFITGWSTAKADKLNSFTTILFRMILPLYYCDERGTTIVVQKHIVFEKNKLLLLLLLTLQ